MPKTDDNAAPGGDFIRSIVTADRAAGKHGGRVHTRFPPEPNGYLHIGHAKSIVLNFGVAGEFGGLCNLRFDDTNPLTEDPEYVDSIERDVRWLGYDWDDRLYFASDYFERMYRDAVGLIERRKAYVDSLSEEEIRAYRGTVTEPGRPSPHRDRPVAESLDLFTRMRAGEFADGAHVLRAKIDMAAANMKMRDPLLYRILHAPHYRTGDDWCIYPMYDYAHPLEDAYEGITHSLCTLEFENNREIYDWVVRETGAEHTPQQIEFARLNLSYTVLSKRKLLELVRDGRVDGWDDPRMPTLSGLRRRGYPPQAIRAFCERIGVAKSNSTVDVASLEHSVRDHLNTEAPRVLAVLRPLKVVIDNYPEGESEELDAPYWPHDVPREGSRKLPFSRVLYIERDDFMEEPPKRFHRLAPGREVRLRYAYFIRCQRVVKDEDGRVVELRCTYDPATRGGSAPDGRKVRGTLHWVSAEHAVTAEVRLYDRLFRVERPGESKDADFLAHLNAESLEVIADARVEPGLAAAEPGSRFQFERQGYFYLEPESAAPGSLAFNRIVPLRDTWAKIAGSEAPPAGTGGGEPKVAASTDRGDVADDAPGASPAGGRRVEETPELLRYRDELGLPDHAAEVLAGDADLRRFFERARERHDNPAGLAAWVVNDLLRELKEHRLGELPFGPGELAELVELVDDGTLSAPLAKEVFALLVERGGRPREIARRRGLEQVSDRDTLAAAVDQVLAAHPAEAAAYRDGKRQLLGFFVGRVMQATGGKADPRLTNELLRQRLGG